MRSSSAGLALLAIPWVLAAACGEPNAPAQSPVVVPPPSASVAEAAPDAAVSAAPIASASAAPEPVASAADAGAPARPGGKKVVSMRQGATTVNGRLPPEVIQRIVRQNFGRFRLCYEKGLKTNPALEGRVTVKFAIDRSGAVSEAKDAGSDLPDAETVACIVKVFANLSYPQPEGGVVVVSYPIIFGQTEAPPPLAPGGSASANLWGDAIGDAFGAGGLGLSGTGGGGRGEGIGLGTLGSDRRSPPSLRQGATTVNGKLPPEVIQRIVRQNFGRFRLCYENGLRKKDDLAGRIAVKFVIDEKGNVSDAKDGGSDLPDKDVVACVVRGFQNLSFPQPEGGVVTVVYPIIFSPGVPAAPAASGSAKP